MYNYIVLSNAPNAIQNHSDAFLVVVRDVSGDDQVPRVFVSDTWEANSIELHQYLTETIEHVLALSPRDFGRFFDDLRDLSVGPIRFSEDGICSEEELLGVLYRVFGESGYFTPGPR